MTKVKICGMRSRHDLEAARQADYVGFILETQSPRCLDVEKAKELMTLTTQKKVLVSTSKDSQRLEQLCKELRPDILQVHSNLSVMELRRLKDVLGIEVWALYTVEEPFDMMRLKVLSNIVDKVLLDSPSPQGGGSGVVNDWYMCREARDFLFPFEVVLAGGLSPDNIAEGVSKVEPAVVDVSSGVEENGAKSVQLIEQFIKESKRK
ncbi:MAG: N-(5'-phosphoribosyl)anthranilate isomerase [Methanomassiliicoccales archaeon PtaU1.Bin124]|nr:MAG: N-(5'-phosphoribosyl)anthranilate isomerase [Methanomassiliicoccales archaeon PtaU1.Bin124]